MMLWCVAHFSIELHRGGDGEGGGLSPSHSLLQYIPLIHEKPINNLL